MLGAIGGVAHHPLQFMMTEGVSPISLVTGVGLGLVGIVTKPLSGAAELVALTGQGKIYQNIIHRLFVILVQKDGIQKT